MKAMELTLLTFTSFRNNRQVPRESIPLKACVAKVSEVNVSAVFLPSLLRSLNCIKRRCPAVVRRTRQA